MVESTVEDLIWKDREIFRGRGCEVPLSATNTWASFFCFTLLFYSTLASHSGFSIIGTQSVHHANGPRYSRQD